MSLSSTLEDSDALISRVNALNLDDSHMTHTSTQILVDKTSLSRIGASSVAAAGGVAAGANVDAPSAGDAGAAAAAAPTAAIQDALRAAGVAPIAAAFKANNIPARLRRSSEAQWKQVAAALGTSLNESAFEDTT